MKILHIAAEHVSGTLSLFQAEHRRRGNECRFVTFFHSPYQFPEDICLNLPFMPNKRWVRFGKRVIDGFRGSNSPRVCTGRPRLWNPPFWERWLFSARDELLRPRIEAAIEKYQLHDFDIYHLDGGLEFYRDARTLKKWIGAGRKIVCFYHGTDLRNRGILPEIDKRTHLRLTSEWDLVELDPRLEYLYLPIDTARFSPKCVNAGQTVKICHAARNVYKGTESVIRAFQELRKEFDIQLVLLQNVPYEEALTLKSECDIFVDQLTNEGGWGYGMSAVEALAMGMPVVTNIPEKMAARLVEPPFVQATPDSLTQVLSSLIRNKEQREEVGRRGRQWVAEWHDIKRVGDVLYGYYRREGWI
jgi:glycosyltransferase involved in cell wall biosynthesis